MIEFKRNFIKFTPIGNTISLYTELIIDGEVVIFRRDDKCNNILDFFYLVFW